VGILKISSFHIEGCSLTCENDFGLDRVDDWPSKPRSADASSGRLHRAVAAGVVDNLESWGPSGDNQTDGARPRRLLRA
jgi:hypothetical protein